MNKELIPVVVSSAYLPPISYMAEIVRAGICVIEKHENYSKQTYRNRCEIYAANGRQTLSIPVVKNHNTKTKICDIEIDYKTQWQRTHWRSIISAYRSSPFFLYYADLFEPFYTKQFQNLFVFNQDILKTIIHTFKLPVTATETTEFIKDYPENYLDLRTAIHPKMRFNDDRMKMYHQVFVSKHGFISNLSIIDLIFNVGPEITDFLGY